MDTTQPIDVNSPPPTQGRTFMMPPNVRLNGMTTLQSPFFWLVIGAAIGVWICKSGYFQSKAPPPYNRV